MFGSARWFVRFRWWGLFVSALLISAGIWIFQMTMPVFWISLFVLGVLASNVLVDAFESSKKLSPQLVGAFLLLDVLFISTGLALTGGPANPFTVLLLLPVALSVVLAGESWAWATAFLSILCFATSFRYHVNVPEWGHQMHSGSFVSHLYGMLAAYTLTAVIVAYFLARISGEHTRAKGEVERLKVVNQNYARLATVTAYAAGAAHELSSPLGTITVAAHEILRRQQKGATDYKALSENTVRDLLLIQEESERCRMILNNLLASSGNFSGEKLSLITVGDLLTTAADHLVIAPGVLSISGELSVQLRAPREMLGQAIRGLLKNALDAESSAVAVSCRYSQTSIVITIADNGIGLPDELLEVLGEPFVSSKPAGKGTGLGVYVARTLTKELGGSLTLVSRSEREPGKRGTVAEIILPRSGIEVLEQ